MALTRQTKEALLATYGDGLASSPHAFLLGFEGVTVAQAEDLRDRIRTNGGHYMVVKNRLALRAIEGTAMQPLAEHFTGATGVAFSHDDPVGLAKALSGFAKENPSVVFKAGLVDGQTVAAADISTIAAMPSREELITKLVFLLQSPVTRFVRGLNAITQQFVTVLDQVGTTKTE